MASKTFGLLGVGNELLSGKVVDTNLSYWIREFKKLGRRIEMAVMVPDERPILVDTIRYVRQRCDTLFISGGIGPTHDDITLPALAEALDRPLERNTELAAAIQAHYKDQTNEHLMSMADLPAGTELLFRDELLVPLFYVDDVYVFPGAPTLLRRKFEILARQLSACSVYIKKLYTDFDEGEIASQLASIETDFPGVAVGSYPRYDEADYKVLVTIESSTRAELAKALEALLTPAFRARVLRQAEECVEGDGDPHHEGSFAGDRAPQRQ